MPKLIAIYLSRNAPSLRTEDVAEVVCGPGENDRHNRTITARLTDGQTYLLVRDARYRGRGPGNALVAAIETTLGRPVVEGYAGHPTHDGSWSLWRLPAEGLDVTAGTAPARRLVVNSTEATLADLPVSV